MPAPLWKFYPQLCLSACWWVICAAELLQCCNNHKPAILASHSLHHHPSRACPSPGMFHTTRQHHAVFCIQVVAYLEVTPDVMPAKIYVNETAQALRGFMEPFSQMHPEPSSRNCSDLLNRVMIVGKQEFLKTAGCCSLHQSKSQIFMTIIYAKSQTECVVHSVCAQRLAAKRERRRFLA